MDVLNPPIRERPRATKTWESIKTSSPKPNKASNLGLFSSAPMIRAEF